MASDTPDKRLSSVDRAGDLVTSVKAYALQETIGPLRGAARWMAYGTAASVSLGLGILLLALGVLRLSQDLGGSALDGAWSFVHYLISGAVLGVAVGVSLSRISRNSLGKD